MPPGLSFGSEGAEGVGWSISDLQAGSKVRQNQNLVPDGKGKVLRQRNRNPGQGFLSGGRKLTEWGEICLLETNGVSKNEGREEQLILIASAGCTSTLHVPGNHGFPEQYPRRKSPCLLTLPQPLKVLG